jgi:hypothetical protein
MAYGTVQLDTLQSSSPLTPTAFVDSNGTQVGTLCRAWVNFNGTATSGSATIRASFNVSSVTVNSGGVFTINLTNALVDTNYAISAFARNDQTSNTYGAAVSAFQTGTKTTSALQVFVYYVSPGGGQGVLNSSTEVDVMIFR